MKSGDINYQLGITESYQAPKKMLELMLDPKKRTKLFDAFLEQETDLTYEWFQSYFEDEHSDRKNKKQDFTPRSVSELLAKLSSGNNSYFEAAAGTGGIMIQYWNKNKNNDCWYHVEELSERSTPFLIFNMAIRGMNGIVLRGDSLMKNFLEAYQISNRGKYSDVHKVSVDADTRKFDSVLMNPPFSAKWSSEKHYLEDKRFSDYEALAPKSRADYAFLLHGYYQLEEEGTMAIVLPHGVLFRGGAEEKIRKALLKKGAIKAVIGLPANLFYNTSIPTAIIVLEKNRVDKNVLFIDASKEFEKERSQNLLTQNHINKITNTYLTRVGVDKYAYVANIDDIKDNDFNLNIPRFVDTFEEEEPIDITKLGEEIEIINDELDKAEHDLSSMLDDLAVTDESIELIEVTKKLLRKGEKESKQLNLF